MKKTLILLTLVLCTATASLAWTFGYQNGTPYLRCGLSSGRSIDVGASTANSLGGAYSEQLLLLRYNQEISKVGPVELGWALQLSADRYTATTTSTDLIYSGLLTVEYRPLDQLGVYTNLALVTYEKYENSGVNTQYLNTLTGPFQFFTGVRIYI
jgi:hypothetical protein